jgi:hypothetical protein
LDKNSTTGGIEIPVLPGHYRRTTWYFVRSWLGMVGGIGVFGLGLYWQSVAVQVVGGVIAFVAFLFMFRVMIIAQSAQCPSCSVTMTQGWDSKHQKSDGLFTCPQCHGRWRTRAVWGFD